MKNIFIFLLILSIPLGSNAVNKYWRGSANNNFNNAANWTTDTVTLAATTVPGSLDVAVFTQAFNVKCIINATINVQGIKINSGFNDSIVFNTGTTASTISIGSAGFLQNGGIFRAFTAGKTGPGNITISGPLTISGGNFMGYNGPNAATTQTVTGTFTLSGGTYTASKNTTNLQNGMIKTGGTFSYNTGSTVNFQGKLMNSGIFTIDFNNTSVNFNNVTFTTGLQWDMIANIASGSKIIANGNLIISHNSAYKSDINTGTIEVRGNLTVSGNGLETGGGTGTILINGSGAQNLTGSGTALKSPLPNVTIKKTAGSLTFSSVITFKKNLTLQSDSSIVPLPGSSTVVFTGNDGAIIDNSANVDFTFYNLTVNDVAGSGATTTLVVPTSCSVSNTLNIAGASQVSINGGTIKVNGNGAATGVNLTNTNTTGGGGTATIEMTYSASNTQYINGNTAGTGFLPNVSVNKPGGNISIKDVVAIKGNLTFNGTTNYAVNKNGTTAGIINLHGNLTLPTGSKVNAGTATICIKGTGNQTVTGNTTAGDGKLCNLKIEKSSGTLSLANQIHLGGTFEYVSGTVSPGTSRVNVYNTGTFDPQITVGGAQMNFNELYFFGNRTIDGDMTVNGDLNIQTGITITNTTSKVKLGGNFVYATTTANYTNSGTSSLEFINTAAKQINAPASRNIQNLIMNGSGGVSFVNIVQITNALTLTNGVITSTATGMLRIMDNATSSGGGASSYVSGPMKKLGNDAFIFPTGKGGQYSPISISAPILTTDEFQAEFFNSAQSMGATLEFSLQEISNCNYWDLQRITGSSNVNVGLYWNATTCYNPNPSDYASVARWNTSTSKWEEQGLMNVGGNQTSGSVTTFNTIGSFGKFVLAKKLRNTYVELKPVLDNHYYTAYANKLYVLYEEEYNETTNKKLQYRIYNDLHQKVAEVSNTGTATPSASPLVNITEGKNKVVLDLSGLSLSAGYYTLEVINSKNEKQYLRFKM